MSDDFSDIVIIIVLNDTIGPLPVGISNGRDQIHIRHIHKRTALSEYVNRAAGTRDVVCPAEPTIRAAACVVVDILSAGLWVPCEIT